MDTIKSIIFKFMMVVLAVLFIVGVIYTVLWKVASLIAMAVFLSPFGIAIYLAIKHKMKQIPKLAHNEPEQKSPYKV